MQKTNVKILSCVTLKWSLKLPRQNLFQRKPRMACCTCTIACYIVKAEPLILQVINNMRTQEKETLKLNEHHCHWMLLWSSLSICTVLWPMNCMYSNCPWMYILYYGNCRTAWGTYAHATNELVCVVHHRPTAQECLLCNNQHPRNHPPYLIISATTFHDNWKHSACTLKKCLKAIDWYLLDHSASAALSDSCSNSWVMPTNRARFGCNLFTAARLCPFSKTHPKLSKPTINKPAKFASSHTKFPKQKFAKSNWQRKETES